MCPLNRGKINKKKRRYYYYKCIKVIKGGSKACSLGEVNAEKLELYLFESLERVSKDENYIESLAYKLLRNSPLCQGFELTGVSEKNYSLKVLHVLQGYVLDYKKGSQLEKQLVTKRTIERINFSKEFLEVIVSLEDKREIDLTQGLANRLAGRLSKTRGGAVNPDAPLVILSSELRLAERQGFEPWNPCGLHAFQACRFSRSRISPESEGTSLTQPPPLTESRPNPLVFP